MKKTLKLPSRSETAKRFVALARVSSREQEREGFSLDVQVDAINRYVDQKGGQLVKLYRIAETASKSDERTTFKELVAFVKANAKSLDGLLFYKVDRAARNLFDYVELERLETDYGIPFISISQPTEHTPAGRMQRRVLASMASFYTEQQSIDVREGLARRVQFGLFVGLAPYGYRNVRRDGRSIVEVVEDQADKVIRIFELYAHQNHTLDMIVDRFAKEGIDYRPTQPAWTRSKIHHILRDRAYIGEVFYQDQWFAGSQLPLIERTTWNRVQTLLGVKVYKAHELTYAGGIIRCGHCNCIVTGESVVKKSTGREYVYYRCTMYNTPGHPRVRLTEKQIDKQMLDMFARIKQPDTVRDWFAKMLRLWSVEQQTESRTHAGEIQRELTVLRGQQDRLLNLRLLDEIDKSTFNAKNIELRDRIATLTLQLEAADRGRDEIASLATRVFELSQSLTEQWLAADYAEKRQILEMVVLNFSLVDTTLELTMRKPFDILVEGLLVSSSRGDKI